MTTYAVLNFTTRWQCITINDNSVAGSAAMLEVTTLGRWCGVLLVEFIITLHFEKCIWLTRLAPFVDTKEVFKTV